MAYPEAQTLSAAAGLKYTALLLFSYVLLLIALGLRICEDASPPPWAAFLKYPENFQKDDLARQFARLPFSERTIAAYLYAPLIDRWWLVPVVHVVFSLLLLAGLHRLSLSLVGFSDWSWVGVWLVLPGLYYQHWGSNELYYPYPTPSLLAKGIGVWVWVGLLRDRIGLAAGALLLAAAIHPSVGWQLGIFAAPLAFSSLRRKTALYAGALSLVLGQTLLIGRWAWPPPESKSLWETIFLEFRMGMHFSPTYFKPKSHFLFAGLLLLALWISMRQKHSLRWVFLLYALGLSAYVLNYYTLRWEPLWYSQLSRSTVWLKPLAVFVIVGYLRERFPIRVSLSTSMAIFLAGLGLLILYRLAKSDTVGVQYLQILRWAESPAYRVGQCARMVLPKEALIAASPSYEAQAAQFFSMRSAFLRLDAHFRTPEASIYRSRVKLLYGVDPAEGYPAWQELTRNGRAFYDSIAMHHAALWQAAGITHFITETPGLSLNYPCLCRADNLALWALPTAVAHTGSEHSPIAFRPPAEPEKLPLPDETAPPKKLLLAAQTPAHDKVPEVPLAAPGLSPDRP